MKTGFKKIFLDTAPIIYYLQENESYFAKVENFFLQYPSAVYVTSMVTVAEYFPYPFREKNHAYIQAFSVFVRDMGMEVMEIGWSIAEKSARIRADYPGIKGMDALQLATATLCECDVFLTNDKRLKVFKEVRCLLLDELA